MASTSSSDPGAEMPAQEPAQPAAEPAEAKENKKNCRSVRRIKKKRIIGTDALIKRFYEEKAKSEQLNRDLDSSKEECLRSRIDYHKSLIKSTRLESEVKSLRSLNKKLQEKCNIAENHFHGVQSHANQLQMLLKEKAEIIKALNVEVQLEKAKNIEYQKKLAPF